MCWPRGWENGDWFAAMSLPDVDQAPDQLLLHAVANGDKVKASRSLKAGANPNASNLNGTTPVHVRLPLACNS